MPTGNYRLAVNRQRRYGARSGACGQNDLASPEDSPLWGNLNGIGIPQHGLTLYMLNVVLAQQIGDATNLSLHDTATTLVSLGVVDTEVVEREAPLFSLFQHGDVLRILEQGLAGDTPPVEADAAQLLALYHCDFHAKLGRANGAHIPARASADYQEVVN